jgi:glycosyltransferase involved in cell wall biosynthesis
MKIRHLNYSDTGGGAARAGYRLHQALRRCGISSSMEVAIAELGDWSVNGPKSASQKLASHGRPFAGELLRQLLYPNAEGPTSLGLIPSFKARRLNRCEADVIHLHWVQGEMLSIADIGAIEKPLVWTLHDMWPLCATEHYPTDNCWRQGYIRPQGSPWTWQMLIRRFIFERKRSAWKNQIHLIAPSHWIAKCARESPITEGWPVTVIPNCLDTSVWKPLNSIYCRQLFNLPEHSIVLLFGALGGGADHRKGFDLLQKALPLLQNRIQYQSVHIVVIGEREPAGRTEIGIPVHYLGHLHDEFSLIALYNAVDITVIPSRIDNLPNSALESMACGTPVVSFDIGGMSDLVKHRQTGYLAPPFDIGDLVNGIMWIVEDRERYQKLRQSARALIAELHSEAEVATRHQELYQKIIY